jgi:hypothetical protein
VRRVIEIGALARIELQGIADSGQFEVELPQRDVGELALGIGENVHLIPGKLRVFPLGIDGGSS